MIIAIDSLATSTGKSFLASFLLDIFPNAKGFDCAENPTFWKRYESEALFMGDTPRVEKLDISEDYCAFDLLADFLFDGLAILDLGSLMQSRSFDRWLQDGNINPLNYPIYRWWMMPPDSSMWESLLARQSYPNEIAFANLGTGHFSHWNAEEFPGLYRIIARVKQSIRVENLPRMKIFGASELIFSSELWPLYRYVEYPQNITSIPFMARGTIRRYLRDNEPLFKRILESSLSEESIDTSDFVLF